jgi:hypothetical protein
VYLSLTVQDRQNPLVRLRGVHEYVRAVVEQHRLERSRPDYQKQEVGARYTVCMCTVCMFIVHGVYAHGKRCVCARCVCARYTVCMCTVCIYTVCMCMAHGVYVHETMCACAGAGVRSTVCVM